MKASVRAMIERTTAPTAPLNDFLEDYRQDANVWWRLNTGHQLNLFEEAVDRIDRASKALNG